MASLRFGSYVVHPTKEWPWLGSLEWNQNLNPSTLEKSAYKKKTFDDKLNNQPPTLNAETGAKAPQETSQFPLVDALTVNATSNDKKGKNSDEKAKNEKFSNAEKYSGKVASVPQPIQAKSASTSKSKHTTLKQWRVIWYPTMEQGELDGSEIDLAKSVDYGHHVGTFVRRQNGESSGGGMICGVHFSADVFVLPDYEWVIENVAGDLLKAPRQFFGDWRSYVLYNECWLGIACSTQYKLTLRLVDHPGYRCTIANEFAQMLRGSVGKGREAGFLSILYEGQAVEGPLSALVCAEWIESPDGCAPPAIRDAISATLATAAVHAKDGMASAQNGRRAWGRFSGSGPAPAVIKWPTSVRPSGDEAQAFISFFVDRIELSGLEVDWQQWLSSDDSKWYPAKDYASGVRHGGAVLRTPKKASAQSARLSKEPRPPSSIRGEELKKAELLAIPSANRWHDFRAKYMYTIREGDKICTREEWRAKFAAERRVAPTRRDIVEQSATSAASAPPRPVVGTEVCVEILLKEDSYDVVWENGETECGIAASSTSTALSGPTFDTPETTPKMTLISDMGVYADARFYPGMYVEQASAIAARPEMLEMIANAKRAVLHQKLKPIAQAVCATRGVNGCAAAVLNEFGIVRQSSTKEKYALVEWFRSMSTGAGPVANAFESTGTSEVSFYDLKALRRLSYRPGELITEVLTGRLGYVRSSDSTGRVSVLWRSSPGRFDVEEQRLPLELSRLVLCQNGLFSGVMPSTASAGVTTAGDGAMATTLDQTIIDLVEESEGEEAEEYFDGEFGVAPGLAFSEEDADPDDEGLKYFNYAALPPKERKKRVAYAVRCLAPIVDALELIVVSVHNLFPRLERRCILREVIRVVDSVCGFLQADDFAQSLGEWWTTNGFLTESQQQPVVAQNDSFEKSVKEMMKDDSAIVQVAPPMQKEEGKEEEGLMYDDFGLVGPFSTVVDDLADRAAALGVTLEQMGFSSGESEEDNAGDAGKMAAAVDAMLKTLPEAGGAQTFSQEGEATSSQVPVPQKRTAWRRPAADLYLQIPADRLYDWITIVESINQTVKSQRKGKKASTSTESQASSSTASATLDTRHRDVYRHCFDVMQHVKRSLVTVSLAIRSGSLSAPLTFHPSTDCSFDEQRSRLSLADAREFLRFFEPKPANAQVLKRVPCFSFQRINADFPDGDAWVQEKWRKPEKFTSRTSLEEFKTPTEVVEGVRKRFEELAKKEEVEMKCEVNAIADALSLALLAVVRELLGLGETIYKEEGELAVFAAGAAEVVEEEQEAEAAVGDAASCEQGTFEMCEKAPADHHYASKKFDMSVAPKTFIRRVQKEIGLLKEMLPVGVHVKAYEDRLDLLSCMIVGPLQTPYEDSLFIFDVLLREEYPLRPPQVFYRSYSRRINPNLYEEGIVCLSLLGTWDGHETELWTTNSNLLQVFISIQSLILVPEPYFNEPGYERTRGTPEGASKSREYNEMTVLRSLECLLKIASEPLEVFKREIADHVRGAGKRILERLVVYENDADSGVIGFPLHPVTQGFRLCVKRYAENLEKLLAESFRFGEKQQSGAL